MVSGNYDAADRDWLAALGAGIERAQDGLLILAVPDEAEEPRLVYANPAWCRLTGYALSEVEGAPATRFAPADDAHHLRERLREARDTRATVTGTNRLLARDGSRLTVDWRVVPLVEPDGSVAYLSMAQRDVSERERIAASVDAQEGRDRLTGLASRPRMQALLETETARADRHGNPLALALIDIDAFTQVNDEHGFDGGDRLLQRVAGLISSRLRRTDLCGRWSSDAFLVLLPHTRLDGATDCARHIDRAIAAASDPDPCPITVSIGVAEHVCGDAPDAAVEAAVKALRTAKRSGGHRIVPAFGRYDSA